MSTNTTPTTLDGFHQQAAQVRAITDAAERKAASSVLSLTIRRIAWSSTRRAEALALADALAGEASAIEADELSGLDALAARGALCPL